MPPSQHRLKLVAKSPELFAVRLQIGDTREYQVPADGRVTLDVPAYRSECSVFLFDRIRVRGGESPFTAKAVAIVKGGKVTRQLSLKDIFGLSEDREGYHLLTLGKTE